MVGNPHGRRIGIVFEGAAFNAVIINMTALDQNILSLPTVDVIGGQWNFVPVISLDDLEVIPQGTELSANVYLGFNLDETSIWTSGWTFQQGRWEAILPFIAAIFNGTQDTGEVLIGRGYWVFFTEDRTLIPGTTQ